jgi:hypothetical protein
VVRVGPYSDEYRGRDAYIQEFEWAFNECQQRIGKTLGRDARRRLHDEISGEGLTKYEIIERCVDMFGDHN